MSEEAAKPEPRPARFDIREATPRHVSALMALLTRFHEEASEALAWPPISELHLMHSVANVITNGKAFIAVQDGKMVGSIGLRIDQFFWSGTPYVGDAWFYVAPAARSFPLFRGLVLAAAGWADQLSGGKPHLAPLMFATVGAVDVERLEALYQRVGFLRAGGLFVRGL